MTLIYQIKQPEEKKWHPVESHEYYAHLGPRNIINTDEAWILQRQEHHVFVEVRCGKKMVFFGTPENAIKGLEDIADRGNIDLREPNIVGIKMYGMNLPKARQNNIVLDKNDLMAPGLLLLSFEIKNYTPTKEEAEAEKKTKEAEKHKPKEVKLEAETTKAMKPYDVVSPINDPNLCIRWVHSIHLSTGWIKVIEEREDRSIISLWLDQKLWLKACETKVEHGK